MTEQQKIRDLNKKIQKITMNSLYGECGVVSTTWLFNHFFGLQKNIERRNKINRIYGKK